MKRKDTESDFKKLVRLAEEHNARPGNDKRFFPIADYRRGRLITLGMYDYVTKKFATSDLLAHNVQSVLSDIDDMVTNPGPAKVLPVIA